MIYGWLITKHNFNQEQLDKRIRSNIAWLILLSFAIDGIFGIAVAVYVDILPLHATVSQNYYFSDIASAVKLSFLRIYLMICVKTLSSSNF